MTRLILTRHAPTAETGRVLTGRMPGVPLDEEGQRQADALGTALAEMDVAAVYTSPVLRCRQTARAIAHPHGMATTPLSGLSEVDYGRWAGRSLASLRRTKKWSELYVAPSRVRFPEGETLAEVQARAVAACETIIAEHPNAAVVAVSHGDVIKAIVAHYLGTPLDLFQRIAIGPSSRSIIEVARSGAPAVRAVNLPLEAR